MMAVSIAYEVVKDGGVYDIQQAVVMRLVKRKLLYSLTVVVICLPPTDKWQTQMTHQTQNDTGHR